MCLRLKQANEKAKCLGYFVVAEGCAIDATQQGGAGSANAGRFR